MKKSIEQLNVTGLAVLVRLDLNVPLDSAGRITDDRRIVSALPTVRRIIDGGGRAILMSHLGRPKGAPDDRKKLSLAPVAKRIGELIQRPLDMLDDCVGDSVVSAVAQMKSGEVCVLENLRFHSAETIKDKDAAKDAALRNAKDDFARSLAELADAYVNDAFGTCHRDNASMLTVPKMMEGKPRVVGYLVQKELRFLGGAVADPQRPFVCVLGGAKVSDKLGVIHSLLDKCDTILIGGAMAYTFLSARGESIGKSLVEPDLFDTARALLAEAGDRLRLPVDSVAATRIAENQPHQTFTGAIPADQMGLDIGETTREAFGQIIAGAKTIVWNGPMGVFETPPFDAGTLAIARAMADATDRGAITIIGGGDSAAAVQQAGLADRMSHISTGGGASLEFLEGKPFAPIDALDDA